MQEKTYIEKSSFLNIVDLPVDRIQAVLLQKLVGSAEMLASKEASVRRKRTWMRCFKYQMFGVVEHTLFHLRRSPPQHVDNRSVLLVYLSDDSIGKLFPASSLVGVCRVRSYSKNRVEQKNALICPLFKIAVIRYLAAKIVI